MLQIIQTALIAFGELMIPLIFVVFIVRMILKFNPSNFRITWSEYGCIEVDFASKANVDSAK